MAPPLAWISLSSHGLHLRTTGFAEGNGELESSRKKKGVSVAYINRRNLDRTCPIRRLLENPGRTVFHLPPTRTASEIPSAPSVGRGVGLPLASRPTGQPADIVGASAPTPPCPQPGTPKAKAMGERSSGRVLALARRFAGLLPNDTEIEETSLASGVHRRRRREPTTMRLPS